MLIEALSSLKPTSTITKVADIKDLSEITKVKETTKLQTIDTLSIASNKASDTEILDSLKAVSSTLGSLRKWGFFSNPKISTEEALKRLKDKDTVFIKYDGFKDSMKTLNDLFLLDSLVGRKQDHHVAKADIRLPLLFLESKGLGQYVEDDDGWDEYEKMSIYNAYKNLESSKRSSILVGKDKKKVKRSELADFAVKNIPVDVDPGKKLYNELKLLDTAKWKIDGQNGSTNLTYLGVLAGSKGITYNGTKVEGKDDLAILTNLVGGQFNGAVPPHYRAILLSLDVSKFKTPQSQSLDYYGVYKALQTGEKVLYDSKNVFESLNDLLIYNVLEISQSCSSLIPKDLAGALHYFNDGNLKLDGKISNAYMAYKALEKDEGNFSYTFTGGPLNQPITVSPHDKESFIMAAYKVKDQRQADQFHPDINTFKSITSEITGIISNALTVNLQKAIDKAEKATKDIPVQEQRLKTAQREYNQYKPLYDQAASKLRDIQYDYDRAKSTYNSTKRDYQREVDQLDRYQRDYNWAQSRYDSYNRSYYSYEDRARREDSLASSDPQSASAHRQKAAEYRRQAQSYKSQAQTEWRNMERIRWDIQRQQNDVRWAKQNMDDAKRKVDDIEYKLRDAKYEADKYKRYVDDSKFKMDNANIAILNDKKAIKDADTIKDLTAKMQDGVNTLNTVKQYSSHENYISDKDALKTTAGNLMLGSGNPLYKKLYGTEILNQTKLLNTLLTNMDKPAES